MALIRHPSEEPQKGHANNEQRVAQIIEAGLKLAAKGGMSAVTLSAVAREINCRSHGAVAFHTKNLKGLHKMVRAEAIRRKDQGVLAHLRAAGERV